MKFNNVSTTSSAERENLIMKFNNVSTTSSVMQDREKWKEIDGT
jgi:hypothetical protein